jgi:hypothetical protein
MHRDGEIMEVVSLRRRTGLLSGPWLSCSLNCPSSTVRVIAVITGSTSNSVASIWFSSSISSFGNLKGYGNIFFYYLLYRFCVLFLEIFWLKIICCPPSWINFYLIIGDFSDVISRVSHIKLHLNEQITLSLVWKVVRQFFISNGYWSIWFWAHNNQLLYVTCISAKIQDGGKLAHLWS